MRYIIKCGDLYVTDIKWGGLFNTTLMEVILRPDDPKTYSEETAKTLAEKLQGDLIEI